MKTKLTVDQKRKERILSFLYDEGQLDFNSYEKRLISIVGKENTRKYKVIMSGIIYPVIEVI